MGYKVAAPLTHQSPHGPGRGRKKTSRYIVTWVFFPGNYEGLIRRWTQSMRWTHYRWTGCNMVAFKSTESWVSASWSVWETTDVENPCSHQGNGNLLTTISMTCIIFPLLVLASTWLILFWINRTNVPQLDVKSCGSAVGEKYEAVLSLVFFCSKEGWQLLNGFIWAFLLQNLVLSFR